MTHRSSQWMIYLIILLLFNTVLASKNPDNRFRSDIFNTLEEEFSLSGLPCGFSIPLHLLHHRDELDENLKLRLQKPFLSPPSLEDSVMSPSNKFMLHFDKTGNHAVPSQDILNNGVPDYIDSAAVILDLVWSMEIDSLGFQPPLNIDGEPVSVYHVYFQNLGNEYGIAFPIEVIPGEADYYRYTSYLILDNDYLNETYTIRGLDGLKISAAHEFQHSIQMGYRIWWEDSEPVDLFFMEMTATWMEDVVFDHINGYLEYLPYFFRKFSNSSFTSDDFLYPYGNSLFLHMLQKDYGNQVGSLIWERIRGKRGLAAIEDFLTSQNSSLLSKLHQYGIWLYYSGEDASQLFFPEASLYPDLFVAPEDSLYLNSQMTHQKSLSVLATRICQINQVRDGEYQAEAIGQFGKGLVSHLTPNGIINTISFNQTGNMYVGTSGGIMLLLTNASHDSITVNYSLKPGLDIPENDLFVSPNPVVVDNHKELFFANISHTGQIHIFNSNGEKVIQLEVTQPYRRINWNLRDQYGEQVSSGIYLYLFQGEKNTKTGKIAIIR